MLLGAWLLRSRNILSFPFFHKQHIVRTSHTHPPLLLPENQHGPSLKECPNSIILANSAYYKNLLYMCGKRKLLSEGKRIHLQLIKTGLKLDLDLNNRIIWMYLECKNVKDARKVFNNLDERNVVSWTMIIAAHTACGHVKEAIKLFQQMLSHSIMPDRVALISILSACADSKFLPLGRLIYAYSVETGMASDVIIGGALVGMFGKCGDLVDAVRVFNTMPVHNVASCNAMIAGYARHGHTDDAFRLLQQMQHQRVKPDKITFVNILSALTRPEALMLGKVVHANICRNGGDLDVIIGNALVSMYGKCGSINDASSVFDKMLRRDVISWTVMIAIYAKHGYGAHAFDLFYEMQEGGMRPDSITFITILDACVSPETLELGKLVHAHIPRDLFNADLVIANALVCMYAKCNSIKEAQHVFDKILEKDIVSWNTMIMGYAQNGYTREAFRNFQLMQLEGFYPDDVTCINVLQACSCLEGFPLGKLIHAIMVTRGIELHDAVGNALLHLYSKCRSMEDACRIFNQMPERNVISWTAIISGYACSGHCKEAFKLFRQMQEDGIQPNRITFISILNACLNPEYLALGKLLHAYISNSGLVSDIAVGNALICMYFKCGSIEEARLVFHNMGKRDVISWTVMVAGYAQQNFNEEAFILFLQMQQDGMKPNKTTFINVLEACASLAVLAKGKLVHDVVVSSGIQQDTSLGTSLVKMYGNCGSLEDARVVFDNMNGGDIDMWNTMIAVYGQHGHGEEAFQLFQKMQKHGLDPDEMTLIGVLYACSHAGMVDEGLQCFNLMYQKHHIELTLEHYNCMVDLLGRGGWLDDAEEYVNIMPFEPTVVTWMSLLSSCKLHGFIKQGKYAAQCAAELEPNFASSYIMASNICATDDTR